MSVRIRLTEGSSPGLQATDAGILPPGFPFSVSVWFRIETDDDTGGQIVWWYGDESATGNSFLLQFNNTNDLLELDAGSAYSTISTLQSATTVSRYEWHLVTIVAEYNGSTTLTHTMYIDGAVSPQGPVTVNKTGTTTTPSTGAWDRVSVGRRDDSPIRPLDGCVEQLAIWDSHAVSLSDHQKMWSDLAFSNLRRPPSVVVPQPNIAWWMLTGHHRHGLKIDQDDGQQSGNKDFGELVNFVDAGGDPALASILDPEEDPVPTWSVESPFVYYPPPTVGDYPARPPKHAPHRCFPRFVIYQKPELFMPWNQPGMEGKHPLYNDPNWVVLSRIAFNQVNNDNRSPPVFEDVDYIPQTYVTNVARRIADWFEYQGFWGPTTMIRADDDPEPGSLFVQTLGVQLDAAFDDEGDPIPDYGSYGLNTDEPTAGGGNGAGFGIPLQQHPLDKLIADAMHTADLGDNFVSMYAKNGAELCRDWSDAFWPSLASELARRKQDVTNVPLASPSRAIWDYESSPQPERFCQQDLPDEMGDGNWFFHKCLDGSNSCMPAVARWTSTAEYVAQLESMGSFISVSLASLGIAAPVVTQVFTHSDNDDFRRDILAWDSPARQYALFHGVQEPAEAAFPSLLWSNYWDLSADRPGLQSYFRATKKNYNTPTDSGIRAKYSAPILYPPPGGQLGFFAQFPNGPRTLTGAYIAYVWAELDACAGALRPLPLQPWLSAIGVLVSEGDAPVYEVSQADFRTILHMCWARGTSEFNLFVSTGLVGDDADEGEGWNGGILGEQNGDNAPSPAADLDGTYNEVRLFRNYVEWNASQLHDRTSRHMRLARRG